MDDFYFRGFYNDTTEREAVLNLKYEFSDEYDVRAGYAFHRYWSAGQNWFDDGDQNGTKELPGNMRLRGNVGARFYHTNTSSTGWIQGNNYAYEGTQTVGDSYSGVLPALNAVLEVTPETLVRFAATQNLNRPTIGSLAAQGGVTRNDDGTFNISFGKTGLLSLGVFHKDSKNWIGSFQQNNVPYSATGLTLTPQLASIYPDLTENSLVKSYSYPINVDKVKLTGVESAVQLPFYFLPAPFNGLGVLGNVAYVHAHDRLYNKTQSGTTVFLGVVYKY